MMNTLRLEKLSGLIAAHGLDGIAVVPGPNMVYLSGIHSHLSERPIILFYFADDDPAIIIPNLEAMKAEAAGIPADRIFEWTDEDGYAGAFQKACADLELSGASLGVEALHMRVMEVSLLQRYAPDVQIVHAESLLSALRIRKDADEIAAVRKAIAVAEAGMELLLPRISIGQTEKQIAALLTQLLFEQGADSIAFGPIVSAGANGASPHAVPTDRPVQQGDLLLIDWGVYVDGYPSDITRTFAAGEIDAELTAVYNAVQLANERGRTAAGLGATGQDVDRAARAAIVEAGYGDFFIHRTGHGLGIEIHEPPFMMEGNMEPLTAGELFTVEPGIYLPGRGGVRIEDDMVITAVGAECLTTMTRELRVVG